MHFRNLALGLLCGLVIAVGATSARAAEKGAESSEAAPVYAAKGDQTCLKCHDDSEKVMAIMRTPHSITGDVRTPAANHGCESCHGASPEHVAGKGKDKPQPAVRFSGPNISPAAEINAVCLTCHENQARINWVGSQHAKNDVPCTSCHTLHADKDKVLSKTTQPEVCFTCHSEQRAESYRFSHHPVREGKVSCADCHEVHGSPAKALLKEFRLNDTCFNCHAEKRGPFLNEHEPVIKNCALCHTPHGSNWEGMLKAPVAELCTDCHAGQVAHHGSYSNGIYPAQTEQWRNCLECHPAIHGSNQPGGNAFSH